MVGVILNLSLWFALYVLFRDVETVAVGPLNLLLPDITQPELLAMSLSLLAAGALFGLKWGVLRTLSVTAAAALALHFSWPGLGLGA